MTTISSLMNKIKHKDFSRESRVHLCTIRAFVNACIKLKSDGSTLALLFLHFIRSQTNADSFMSASDAIKKRGHVPRAIPTLSPPRAAAARPPCGRCRLHFSRTAQRTAAAPRRPDDSGPTIGSTSSTSSTRGGIETLTRYVVTEPSLRSIRLRGYVLIAH